KSSGSRSSEPILAQARNSRLFKISDLTLSLKRGISRSSEAALVQARDFSLRRGNSRSSEDPLAQARILQPRQVLNATFLTQERQLSLRRDHSRSGETTLAQARILQYNPGFHPPSNFALIKNYHLQRSSKYREEGLDDCNGSEDENVNEIEGKDLALENIILGETRMRAPIKETRCGCLARMKIHIDKEKGDWYVSYFVDEHNHELVSEHYGAMIASNRRMAEIGVA
ncbi:hypothetical protein Lal_00012395, partial [Lupinus albus]